MKRILVAMLAFPALALGVVIGCNGTPQGGNNNGCMTLGGAADGGCFFPATAGATRTQCGDVLVLPEERNHLLRLGIEHRDGRNGLPEPIGRSEVRPGGRKRLGRPDPSAEGSRANS